MGVEVVISGKALLTCMASSLEELNSLYSEEIESQKKTEKEKQIRHIVPVDWKQYDSSSTFRRLPNIYKYALYVAEKALENAELDLSKIDKNRVGVFYATGLAAVSSVEKFYKTICSDGIEVGSPIIFPNTTVSVGCGLINMKYGFKGKSLAISSAGVAGFQGYDIAKEAIINDELDYAIVVGTEELTEETIKAYYCTRMLEKQENYVGIEPFGKSRNTTALGEGAAAIVLEKKELAVARGKSTNIQLGEMLNVNCNKKKYEVLAHSIEVCMEKNKVDADAVDLVVVAENGNIVLDEMEQLALQKVFGHRLPKLFVPSIYFGETGGASGILGIICAEEMFEKNQMMMMPSDVQKQMKQEVDEKESKKIENILIISKSFYGDFACLMMKK